MNILLLASQSPSRQILLREAQIPFELVKQEADETQCDWGLPLPQLVREIARYKMNHAMLPPGTKEGEMCFVLTADTLSQDKHGNIHGKPIDRADAIAKIKAAREGNFLCTAFCLDRKVWKNGAWHVDQCVQECVRAEYDFIIPDAWLDSYFEKSMGLQCAGSIAIEGYGGLFLKTVHGSYTAIVGLPLFEVRLALEQVGFFE